MSLEFGFALLAGLAALIASNVGLWIQIWELKSNKKDRGEL